MQTPDIAILILSVLDAGMILLAYQLDKKMYRPSAFMRIEAVNSTLFLNREFDEPVNRLLLSKGGTLVITIFFLTAILLKLIH
jgi:hypothetical protein